MSAKHTPGPWEVIGPDLLKQLEAALPLVQAWESHLGIKSRMSHEIRQLIAKAHGQ